jgi:hypothetical protein
MLRSRRGYLRPARFAGAAAALFAAHRFLRASESLFRPSGVIPPFRLAGAAGAEAAELPRLAAHLALSASESLLRPSGVIPPLRFAVRWPDGAAAGLAGGAASNPVPSISRNAAKARSIAVLCCSRFLIISLFVIFSSFDLIGSTKTDHNALSGFFLQRLISPSKFA